MGKDESKNNLLSNDDISIWERVVQTLDRIFPGRKLQEPDPEEEYEEEDVEIASIPFSFTASITPPKNTNYPYLHIGDLSAVDGSNATKLRKGKYPVQATMDLHGLNQGEAYGALIAFIASAYGRGKRCVLIITGKGNRGEDHGVLRMQVPRWLNSPEIRDKILGFTYAAQADGGEGALYVLLKRQR